MTESAEIRLKRLKMRADHRGTQEMDIVLGGFAAREMAGLDAGTLDRFEALLDESDKDITLWISGRAPVPAPYSALIVRIRAAIRRQ